MASTGHPATQKIARKTSNLRQIFFARESAGALGGWRLPLSQTQKFRFFHRGHRRRRHPEGQLQAWPLALFLVLIFGPPPAVPILLYDFKILATFPVVIGDADGAQHFASLRRRRGVWSDTSRRRLVFPVPNSAGFAGRVLSHTMLSGTFPRSSRECWRHTSSNFGTISS